VNMGPRVHDMELKDIIDIVLKVRAGGYSFEAANPRHEHEWEEWRRVKLPDDKVLIPGVITQSTILVEHPELSCTPDPAVCRRRGAGTRYCSRRLRVRLFRRIERGAGPISVSPSAGNGRSCESKH
jgi:hypothetical protein